MQYGKITEVLNEKDITIGECTLADIVNELASYDGTLDSYQVFDMDELDEFLGNYPPTYILERAFYGEFNPNDNWFRFDGYGNLESLDDEEREWELMDNADEILETLAESMDEVDVEQILYNNFDTDEITEIINTLKMFS